MLAAHFLLNVTRDLPPKLLSDREAARAMGERGRKVFEEQQGATGRTVEAIVAMIHTGAKP